MSAEATTVSETTGAPVRESGLGRTLRLIATARNALLLALFALMFGYFSIFVPHFFEAYNIYQVVQDGVIISILAIGETIVILSGGGGIDVSIGSMLALCMLMAAKAMVAGADLLLVLLVALAAGLALGLFNGTIVAYGRIHPIIVTLGTLNIFRALHIQILGPQWITPPPVARVLALGTVLGLPAPWWLAVVLGVMASGVLLRRPLGRHVYALGGNPEAARLAGVNVRLVTIIVYAVTGVVVGLAAVIQLGLSGTVQPNAGTGLELQVIAATVIGGTSILGGRGTVAGSILGAVLVETVHSALITIGTVGLLEGLVVGLLILIAVGFDVLQNRGATKV